MCSDRIDVICRMNLLQDLVESYVLSCRSSKDCSAKRRDRFPNLSGFCRFCGIGSYELSEMKKLHPDHYTSLCFILEDEALNSELSPTVLSSYLKKHLDFSENAESLSELNAGELRLIFEHDIEKDGE